MESRKLIGLYLLAQRLRSVADGIDNVIEHDEAALESMGHHAQVLRECIRDLGEELEKLTDSLSG